MKRIIFKTAAAFWVAAVLVFIPAKADVVVSARSAVLLDAGSGRVLWEKNANQQSLIASTTKIMTGLLIAEECSLDDIVLIPHHATIMEGSSLYLKTGESRRLEELLYGMMLHSGNDAAAALAIHHSGSIPQFADRMNEKATELDLHNTHFVNPHGLDEEFHYSTALDLAKLTVAAMNNPVFQKVVSTKTVNFENRCYTNHNKLLWQYDGAIGVKTGYTKAAGRILVSCAEKNGRRLIAVTICAPNDWKDHKALYDYGFSQYTTSTVVQKLEEFGEVDVFGGVKQSVAVCAREAFSYPITEEEYLRREIRLPRCVQAPVIAGEVAGSVVIYKDDKEIGRVPLYWRESVWEVP